MIVLAPIKNKCVSACHSLQRPLFHNNVLQGPHKVMMGNRILSFVNIALSTFLKVGVFCFIRLLKCGPDRHFQRGFIFSYSIERTLFQGGQRSWSHPALTTEWLTIRYFQGHVSLIRHESYHIPRCLHAPFAREPVGSNPLRVPFCMYHF